MKQFDQWQFPDVEQHLQEWMASANDRRHGRLTYQAHKYDEALKHVRHRGVAIDVGGHVGLWSFLMAHDFGRVEAFEPVVMHRNCFRANLSGFDNVSLHHCALGASHGRVALETRPGVSSGDTGISGEGDIEMIPLDSKQYPAVDFMKIDCEGYEAAVIEGALHTIERCRPVIIVEQKGGMSAKYNFKRREAIKKLKKMGMRQAACISGDHVMVWAS